MVSACVVDDDDDMMKRSASAAEVSLCAVVNDVTKQAFVAATDAVVVVAATEDEDEDEDEMRRDARFRRRVCGHDSDDVVVVWCRRCSRGVVTVGCLLALLYLFICSLDLLGSAFRLLGGRAAGAVFSNSVLLLNPVGGLMIGVLATVLVQSSSTSSSIVVTMVASGIVQVQTAIPIIMGANIGTSVTNTIVSLAQSSNGKEFERAFGGATVHDMFNWLTVIVLLPLEMCTGYLYRLTSLLVSSLSGRAGGVAEGVANTDILQTITKPLTQLIVQLDKHVIEGLASGDEQYVNRSLIKSCQHSDVSNVTAGLVTNMSSSNMSTLVVNTVATDSQQSCVFVFANCGLSDVTVGLILLLCSLLLLCSSLVLMVKMLNSALRGSVLTTVQRTINADLPGCAAGLTGYLAMLLGALMTMLVQSSSVFTSVLTPLVGVGVVSLDRMYPLTLGANIGTTTTGLLAALAASGDQLTPALHIALCHMFFNLSGILLFYPVPLMRRLPVRLAQLMGRTTGHYRWFAILYVIVMFFAAPLSVLALSLLGSVVLIVVLSLVLFAASTVIFINVLQRRHPTILPRWLRTWHLLPVCLRSLDPMDRLIQAAVGKLCCCCSCCQKLMNPAAHDAAQTNNPASKDAPVMDTEMTVMPSLCNSTPPGAPQTDVTTRLLDEDTDSGVWSLAPSRLASYAQLSLAGQDAVSAAAASRLLAQLADSQTDPTPSRLSSFARIPFDVIVEMDCAPADDHVTTLATQ